MPRLPRYILPGEPQHVIQRGNNKANIFLSEDDYKYFQHYLCEACDRYDCLVHAWVFMPNHIHLLMTPKNENSISKTMQSVGCRYVQYFNARYQRTGTLWEGRYKATLVDAENYLLTCYRYIELNPVRSNLVSRPEEYVWSSYHSNAQGCRDYLTSPHNNYLALGETHESRQKVYRTLFSKKIDEKTLEEVRHSTQKEWALGSEEFNCEVEQLVKRRTRPLPRGGDHRSEEYKKASSLTLESID